MAATKKTKEGELVMRVSKIIQEKQYEPLIFDATIRETCPQESYSERIKELSDLLYLEAAEFLGIETEPSEENQPETEVEESTETIPPDENLGEESSEEDLGGDIFDDVNLDEDVPF